LNKATSTSQREGLRRGEEKQHVPGTREGKPLLKPWKTKVSRKKQHRLGKKKGLIPVENREKTWEEEQYSNPSGTEKGGTNNKTEPYFGQKGTGSRGRGGDRGLKAMCRKVTSGKKGKILCQGEGGQDAVHTHKRGQIFTTK